MSDVCPFELVTLRNGGVSIRSLRHGETMHIGSDPVTEAAALHVNQQRLADRAREWRGGVPFAVWDIGLGPAANALAAIGALRKVAVPVEIHSFEIDTTVLEFALGHARELGYLLGWEEIVGEFLATGSARITPAIEWRLHRGDFSSTKPGAPVPSAVMFDPYSPTRNPEMWSIGVFRSILDATDPAIPCVLTNYTRSTSARVTMLLAGWYVGRGVATGDKEETTIAANGPNLLDELLGAEWIGRVSSSTNAAPLREGEGHRGFSPIDPADLDLLLRHPQFL